MKPKPTPRLRSERFGEITPAEMAKIGAARADGPTDLTACCISQLAQTCDCQEESP